MNGFYLGVTWTILEVIWSIFCFIKEGLLKHCLYLLGGLYSEVVFNTGLTVLSSLSLDDYEI